MLPKLCLLLTLLICISQSVPKPQPNLETLISEVFQSNKEYLNQICELGYECVPYYICKDNKIITDGAGVNYSRIDDGTDAAVPKKCEFPDTCCARESQTDFNTLIRDIFDLNRICEVGYECVPYYLCKNNKIVTDGAGLIDIKIGDVTDAAVPKKCEYLETCCAKESKSVPNPQTDLDTLISEAFKSNKEYLNQTCELGYECVPYYLCKNNKIITDEAGLIDIRIDDGTDASVPKKCEYPDTCCAKESKTPKPLYKVPTTVQLGCGIRNVDGIGSKSISDKDNESEYGEFPWMVAIFREEQVANKILEVFFYCGGSLITSSVVLTAAHCVANKPVNSIRVRAGDRDTQTKTELFRDQDRSLVDIVVHENFSKGGLFNDIALLFVSTPFEFQENIQTICLPPHGTNFDHLHCFATGWGTDKYEQAGQYQGILKRIDLPIIPNLQCQTTLRTTRLGQNFELHESFLCAGGEIGKDTCKGDGGSPLVCPIPNTINRYYQAGIVAGGIGCGDAIPGVYANISYLRPWIDEVLAKKKYTSYTIYL